MRKLFHQAPSFPKTYAAPSSQILVWSCAPVITKACEGVRINNLDQILSTKVIEVPDIFAAGVDAGGIFGRHYAGFLGWPLVSGRLSGKAAAGSRRQRVAAIKVRAC